MAQRTIQFPLTLPQDPRRRAVCVDLLAHQLASRHGIKRTRVLQPEPTDDASPAPSPTLELTYDPATLSLDELRRVVMQTEASVDGNLAQLVLPIEGLVSPRKEGQVQAMLNRLPGITAVVSFSSQNIRLEFDRSQCALPEVVRQLGRLNIRIRPPRDAGQRTPAPLSMLRQLWAGARQYVMLSTAIVGGVFLLAGAIVHWTDGPQPLRLALLAVSFALCGWHTARETLRTLMRLRVDIDVLMFAAALGAAALGHYEEGALLLLLFALGGAGEKLAMGRARQAIEALYQLTPETATRIEDGRDRIVRVEELAVGDRIRIAADERIAADAQIIEGQSAIDQSPITGESVPVEKSPGDAVFAGTINGPGALIAAVTKPASENTLAKVIRLVEQAQTSKSPTQQLAERFERWYVPFVLISTAVLIVLPPLLGITPRQHDGALWGGWFYQALAFLTAASPCALAIGTPAAVLSGIGKAARLGVLVKGGAHLENLAQIKVVAFDKTGTLTPGRPRVTGVHALHPDDDEADLLRLAAAVEQGSRHPLAEAIVNEANARGLTLPEAFDITSATGLGIHGQVDGQRITIGSPAMLDSALEADPPTRARILELQQQGQTVVCIARDQRVAGLLALADEPRPTAAAAIRALHKAGITRTVILTGDNPEAAAFIANRVGIDRVEANLLPEQKLDRIHELDAEFGGVAMVGDGVNDAPALAAASVGIAIGGASGGGSDVALETADVALLADDLHKLPEAIALARFTRHIIRQNLLIAMGVIVMLAPLAAVGLAPISLAVLFHEGSTVVVVLNALRILAHRGGKVGEGT